MKKILFLIFALIGFISSNAQTYLFNTSTTAITTCSGTLYDNGGASGNFTPNQTLTLTITPANPGTSVEMVFTQWDVANGTLAIYNGPNTSSPQLGQTYSSAYSPQNIQIMATASNPSGKLTLVWTSGSTAAPGFAATLGCHTPCQNVIVEIDSLSCVPIMSHNYIDVCSGAPVTFQAHGIYPENGLAYTQSDASSLFIWNFGDGSSDTGQVVTHTYINPSGYDFSVRVEDNHGCKNTNWKAGRVRYSSNPIVDIKPLPDICAGDTISVSVGLNALSTIVINETQGGASGTLALADTVFLPDGSGASYMSNLTYSVFPTGMTLSNISDLLGVCLNMEHTYMGDLKISLICPNGNSVVLLNYPNSGGGTILGRPVGADLPVDANTWNTTPGIGFEYCFSPTSTNGYIDNASNWTTVAPYVDPIGQSSPSVKQANAGTYQAVGNWNNLLGCPLNGTWKINVIDNLAADNGYIFSWGLSLNPALIPGGWTYNVPVDSVSWSGPFIQATSDSTANITPLNAGTFQYTMTLYDSFGCSYDTTFSVNVLANPTPNLGNDTTLCEGSVITLNAGPGNQYFWSTGANTQTIVPDASGIYAVTVTNSNANVACYGSDTIEVAMIPWASVNLGPDLCETNPVTLDAQNPGFDYHWSNGATTQTTTITSTGVYSVTVSYGGANECSDTDTINVSIIPTPIVNLGPDIEMCKHEFRDLDVSQATPQYTYQWSNGSTSPYLHVSNMPVGPVTYSVTVTGCDSKSDTITISVIACDLTIPNIITPNSDGFNDVFEVINLPYYPNSIFMVYNRWGKKVYESSNYMNDWDGGNLADGTYFVVLRVNYGNEEYEDHQGTLTIMRK